VRGAGLSNALVKRTPQQLVEVWLATRRSESTRRQYRRYANELFEAIDKPLDSMDLEDLVAYFGRFSDLKATTQAARVRVVKSLFSFALKIGYITINPASIIPTPRVPRRIDTRILAEDEVQRMLALERNPRNQAVLCLLYYGGMRAQEVVGLDWTDLSEREEGRGQVAIVGKGEKERFVLLPARIWSKINVVRPTQKGLSNPPTPKSLSVADSGRRLPVFRSQKGRGRLSARQVHRIVRAAALRAGIDKPVSPHWLRHCHASHSLRRGCAVNIIQDTLGHSSIATTSAYLHSRPGESSALWLE